MKRKPSFTERELRIMGLIGSHKELGTKKSYVEYRVKLAFDNVTTEEFNKLYLIAE